MSGHSKWATIKRAKGAKDAKRGNVFTKLGNNITLAARQGGGDPEMNFKLRLAIDRAKSFNLPKDNIERAIKRGTGELGGATIEEIFYGALLPGQVAVVIKGLTDNKNRIVTEVKNTVTKNGGQFVEFASVAWQFEQKGVIRINRPEAISMGQADLEMKIIESGAEDYEMDNDEIVVCTEPGELQKVKERLDRAGLTITSADLELVAKDKKALSGGELSKVEKIFEALDELDDVSDYYTNLN